MFVTFPRCAKPYAEKPSVPTELIGPGRLSDRRLDRLGNRGGRTTDQRLQVTGIGVEFAAGDGPSEPASMVATCSGMPVPASNAA